MSVRDEHNMEHLPKASQFFKKKTGKSDKQSGGKSKSESLVDWIAGRRSHFAGKGKNVVKTKGGK